MFKRDSYVKLVDINGNFRFGYITGVKEHGDLVTIDFTSEGLSKINYDTQFSGETNFQAILTEIEKKIIPMLAELMTTKEIALKLGVSPITIRLHIRDLKMKLMCNTREQLLAYAQGIENKL